VAAPAHSFDWPWQETPRESYSYCRGFVHSGLAQVAEKGAARIQLWLDWNDATRTQFSEGQLDQAQYDAGQARFGELLAANDTATLESVIAKECNFST
jgi:hypothetical protein